MRWIGLSQEHLREVNQTYYQHALFAIKWGLYLVGTGVVSIIHGVVPGLFPFTAPKNILRLSQLVESRHNFAKTETMSKEPRNKGGDLNAPTLI
jgi:hypothetical protein